MITIKSAEKLRVSGLIGGLVNCCVLVVIGQSPANGIVLPTVPGLDLNLVQTVTVTGTQETNAFRLNDTRITLRSGSLGVWSYDGGLTWQPGPRGPANGEGAIDLGSAQILSLERTSLEMQVGDNMEFRLRQVRSVDNWKTQRPESAVVNSPLATAFTDDDGTFNPGTGLLSHHGLIQLNNGDLLSSWYGNYLGDTELIDGLDPNFNARKFRAITMTSSDTGKTWDDPVTVAYGTVLDPNTLLEISAFTDPNDPTAILAREGFTESDLVRAPNGDILMVMRTSGRNSTIGQGNFESPMYLSRSTDEGQTWTVPLEIPDTLVGANPNLITLDNGVIVLTYGGYDGNLAFSVDNGLSWKGMFQISTEAADTDVVALGPDKFMVFYKDSPTVTKGSIITVSMVPPISAVASVPEPNSAILLLTMFGASTLSRSRKAA